MKKRSAPRTGARRWCFSGSLWHAKENLAPHNRALTPRHQRANQLKETPALQQQNLTPRCQRENPHKRGTITMQNIDLICVGKLNAKYFAEGVAEYQKRLAAFASFRIVELPEEKIEEKNASDAVVKKGAGQRGQSHPRQRPQGRGHRRPVHRGKTDLLRGAGAVPRRPRKQRRGRRGFRHRLVPRPLGRGQARGGAPVQHGPHHDAPPAGPPCPHRTDLPRLHHQRGDEVS